MRLDRSLARVLVAVGLTVLSAGVAIGQQGATLRLAVVDEGGRPIASAAIILRPELQVPVELPPPYFTDRDGHVEIDGLMAGEWQVEVRREGFMIFSAYVRLAAGVPPVVGFKSKQRTGTFWAPLDVIFEDVDVDFAAAQTQRGSLEKKQRKELKRAEKEARQQEKIAQQRARDAEKAEKLAEKRRDQLGRGAEVATLEPSPTSRPPSTPVQVAAAVPEPGNTSSRSTEPEPEVSSPEADVVGVDVLEQADVSPPPVPEPPPPEPLPEPPVEAPELSREPAPAPSVPSVQARPVLFSGGACPECKRSEWALVVERISGRSAGADESCGSSRQELVEQLVELVLGPGAAELGAYAGPLLDSYGSGIGARLTQEELSVPAFEELTSKDSPCQSVVAILPIGARFVGFRFEALDESGSGDCFGDGECSIGNARWLENPLIERTQTLTIIHTTFLNESKTRERRARLVVLFVPPADWRP